MMMIKKEEDARMGHGGSTFHALLNKTRKNLNVIIRLFEEVESKTCHR